MRPQAAGQQKAQLACAGLALACAYSSSDEFEAAVIAQRRNAGAYGHHHQCHIAVATAVTIAALLLVIAF